ncbi:MAG: hypothetical protein IJ412_08395 [Oscillospiraceae bacterium]|nr:hypothetical protein [Oscillospiraceae bacterium]
MKPVDFMRSALIAEVLFYKQHCLTEMLKKARSKKEKRFKGLYGFLCYGKNRGKKEETLLYLAESIDQAERELQRIKTLKEWFYDSAPFEIPVQLRGMIRIGEAYGYMSSVTWMREREPAAVLDLSNEYGCRKYRKAMLFLQKKADEEVLRTYKALCKTGTGGTDIYYQRLEQEQYAFRALIYSWRMV